MATNQPSRAQPQAEREPAAEDVITQGEYHFLDVGDEKYGECILVIFGDVRILIDGSHQGDFRGRNGHASIPAQLAEVLQEEAPHSITLLVVTHGHADHIGCLPDLVSNGVVQADWAFITDPKLGFGRTAADAVPHDGMTDPRQRLVAALREEDASDLDDDELREFMDAVATVESRYAAFIEDLKTQGTEVVFYQGQALPTRLAKILKPTGATLLGPSQGQLLFCAEQIGKTNKGAEDAADELLQVDASMDDVAMYRAAVERDQFSDASGNARGSGMNCQSITFAFGPKNARVLLAGDMQFAAPGVKGADAEVQQLREAVVAAGPYKVFKTTHHTSHNGQDDDFLTDLGNPPIIVHSGGLRDPSHPFPSVLKLLQDRRSELRFVRTDRNGHITVRPHLDGVEAIEKSRGRLNDFSDNVRDTEIEALLPAAPEAQGAVAAPSAGAQIVIVNLPTGAVDMTVGGVDIVVRGGGRAVSPPVGQDRSGGRGPVRPSPRITPAPSVTLASGRVLPNLLFVTNAERLANNIGRTEARVALDAVRAARRPICEVGGTAPQAASAVRSALVRTPSIEGIVIMGGYDVVPCTVVDVLSPSLRNTLGKSTVEVDEDHFIVWSDEPYGDIDGDRIAERPVSRIPDARDAALFLSALGGRGVGPTVDQRFGVRNVARPFASDVWTQLAGNRELNVSEKFLYTDVISETMTSSQLHYFMLHGDWRDGRGFFGELEDQTGYTNAFVVGSVPSRFHGVAFSGCCWGALTVSQKARDAGAAPLAPRVAERSIALTYLQAGASAFVGCTGAHYSGADTDPDANYAARMHGAFWAALSAGRYSAAVALHKAREEYSALIASRAQDMEPIELARRMKNRAQFTCLGLGW